MLRYRADLCLFSCCPPTPVSKSFFQLSKMPQRMIAYSVVYSLNIIEAIMKERQREYGCSPGLFMTFSHSRLRRNDEVAQEHSKSPINPQNVCNQIVLNS